MKPVFAVLCGVLLTIAGCSATPATQATYYRLANHAPSGRIAVDSSAPVLVIERLELAEFLLQSGLVLQQGDNLLQVSRQHLWAESLDVALPKVLQSDLQSAATAFHIYIQGKDFIASTTYNLRLQIDNFQFTDTGLALLTGQYQLVNAMAGTERLRRNFSFTRDLEQDGYPHAVAQLQTLLEMLARQIAEDLTASTAEDTL